MINPAHLASHLFATHLGVEQRCSQQAACGSRRVLIGTVSPECAAEIEVGWAGSNPALLGWLANWTEKLYWLRELKVAA